MGVLQEIANLFIDVVGPRGTGRAEHNQEPRPLQLALDVLPEALRVDFQVGRVADDRPQVLGVRRVVRRFDQVRGKAIPFQLPVQPAGHATVFRE